MKFAGLEKVSTVDYPKKIVATLFTGGCNFYCEYCHNYSLIKPNSNEINIGEDEIIEFLHKRKKILDGICITGGEPSLWGNNLVDFIKRVKNEIGEEFLVKVDTNGSKPELIEKLIPYVDFFAMDFKSLDYNLFSKIEIDLIKESLNILKRAKDYEVRVTMYPPYISLNDAVGFGDFLKESKKVVIQNYSDKNVYLKRDIKIYSMDELNGFVEKMIECGCRAEVR